MEKSKVVVYSILIVVLLFGLIRIFIGGSGLFFIYELLGFSLLLLLSFIGLMGYHKKWGERALFFVFLLYMGNLVAVWWFKDALYMILLLLALLGFIMAVPKRDERGEISTSPYDNTKQDESPEPHSVVLDEPTTTISSASVQVAAKHSPGKYLASKSSNVYHEPKCDWAKKVKKERRVWFGKKEDAWEKGYKAHGCVQ